MDLRYRLLDPLRGLAALWVFLFHFWFSESSKLALPWLYSLLKLGDRGVPMFFVISGYCLSVSAASAMRRAESPGHFLFRRALRIYPTFWCSVIFIVGTHFLLLAVLQASAVKVPYMLAHRFDAYAFGDWLKVISLTQIFDRDFGIWFGRFGGINGAFWTLAIELQFYIVMAVALWRPKLFNPIIAFISLLSVITYFNHELFGATADSGSFLPYWTWFALGILLCKCFQRDVTPQRLFGRWTPVATLGLIGIVVFGFLANVLCGVEVGRFLFAAAFAVTLWLAKPWNDIWTERIESSQGRFRPFSSGLMLLGAMSYSLYLVHNQIWHSLITLLGQFGISRGILLDLLVIVATCLICYPFYRVCEAPILRIAARQRTSPQPLNLRLRLGEREAGNPANLRQKTSQRRQAA